MTNNTLSKIEQDFDIDEQIAIMSRYYENDSSQGTLAEKEDNYVMRNGKKVNIIEWNNNLPIRK